MSRTEDTWRDIERTTEIHIERIRLWLDLKGKKRIGRVERYIVLGMKRY